MSYPSIRECALAHYHHNIFTLTLSLKDRACPVPPVRVMKKNEDL